jgi:hypothetical protein
VLRRMMTVLATVALPLACIAAAGVQAAPPAAAASWLNPGPSIAANDHNDQWVFWQGTNGRLWEAYNNGKSWRGPTEISQMRRLGSEPTVAVIGVNGVHPYVVWRGTDGALWFGYDTNGWHGPCRLGMGPIPAGSRPSIMSDQSGVLTVAWKGANNALWYAYSTQNPSCRGWSGPHSAGDGPLGSVPSAYGPAGGKYLTATWAGTSPKQSLWYHVAGSLYDMGDGPLGSPPSLTGYPYPSHFMAFWAGQDRALWYAEISTVLASPSDSPAIRLGYGPLGSAPSAAWNGNDTVSGQSWYIVWKGTNNGLWELKITFEVTSFRLQFGQVRGMGPL